METGNVDEGVTPLEDLVGAAVEGTQKAGWEARLAHQRAAVERQENDDGEVKPLGIAKVRYTHDGMIDLIVANPWVAQGEIARHFGYTEAWVSLIFSSDAFKERLEQRKQELIDPAIRASIEERLRAITTRSLEVLGEKLSGDSAKIPDNLALRAAELGLKGLGVGGNAVPNVVLPPNHLETLAQRLVQLQSKVVGGNVFEGEVVHVASD